ncbi:MAG: nucleoside triphosphate pyrophosphohydrolase [Bdellovibrionales bacterium]|nr:nucleoside triphosphate pyrophosphohydrolase [Bdellovibrionales bacterium]
MPKAPENLSSFKALTDVVEALRGPDGCPWDKEQTHQSLTQYAIEEAFELAEAIDQGSQKDLIEELGDLLLQVVLHSEIARQEKRFSIEDVILSINEKMVRRHPHVFADVKADTSEEVIENWQKIKEQEKTEHSKSFSFNIPKNIPALIKSQKIGQKTHKYNFDWNTPQQVVEKIEEELQELKEAIAHKNSNEQQHELGDLLFSTAQLARHLNFDAEQALRKTNTRFETRFAKMHEYAKAESKDFHILTPEELEAYWEKAKIELNKNI